MNKHLIVILLIFLVPLIAYFGLSKNKLTPPPSFASTSGAEIIKFSSPMCYECQELEKVVEEIFPKYNREVSLRKIDVTQKDKTTKEMIKKYNVKLVPTTIFIDEHDNITRRIEGAMQPQIFENYLKELTNG